MGNSVDNMKVVSPYGLIKPVLTGKEAGYGEETFDKPQTPYHRSDSGLDISTNIGTPSVAAADGTVVYSELGHTSWKRQDPNTGEYIDTPYSVLIKLDKPITYKDGRIGYYLYYTHLSKLEFEKHSSDKKEIHVNQGDVIGYTGIANNSPHLHIGIIIEKKQKNYPTDYFSMPEVREMIGIKKGESW
jgi:murein DD-endopeptidase MepM/ murein hydrolase activator NlpD